MERGASAPVFVVIAAAAGPRMKRRVNAGASTRSAALILASTYSSHVNLAGLSSQVAAKVKASYAVGAQLGPPISDRAHTAFVSGMHTALLTAAAAAIVAAIGAVVLLARHPRHAPEPGSKYAQAPVGGIPSLLISRNR